MLTESITPPAIHPGAQGRFTDCLPYQLHRTDESVGRPAHRPDPGRRFAGDDDLRHGQHCRCDRGDDDCALAVRSPTLRPVPASWSTCRSALMRRRRCRPSTQRPGSWHSRRLRRLRRTDPGGRRHDRPVHRVSSKIRSPLCRGGAGDRGGNLRVRFRRTRAPISRTGACFRRDPLMTTLDAAY